MAITCQKQINQQNDKSNPINMVHNIDFRVTYAAADANQGLVQLFNVLCIIYIIYMHNHEWT